MKKMAFLAVTVFGLAALAGGQLKDIPKPRPFFLPRLVISNVQVTANADGFVITFGYKNVGTGALPKASEMPVKPDFRVLIDSREINHGSLFIPDIPAGPGWEVAAFHGGLIKLQPGSGFDYSWFVGNIVTVKINENQVQGMAADSQSYNIKPMALNGSYDVMIAGVSADWDKQNVNITIRVVGQTGSLKKFQLFNIKSGYEFSVFHDIVPGQQLYTITHKMSSGSSYLSVYTADLCLLPFRGGGGTCDLRDVDHRNNKGVYQFHR
jgi:hypothetical protein